MLAWIPLPHSHDRNLSVQAAWGSGCGQSYVYQELYGTNAITFVRVAACKRRWAPAMQLVPTRGHKAEDVHAQRRRDMLP